MDPNVALQELRKAVAEMREEMDKGFGGDTGDASASAIQHFEALDGWLSRGGVLPRAWKQHG